MKKYLIALIIGLFFCSNGVLTAQDYIVGEGDVLKISVYEHPDLTTVTRVSGEGIIVVPLIGQINVMDFSVSRIADKITGLLADGYIINPQVNVFIEEYRSKKAVILGQVNSPGMYELREHTTFLEFISKAGGLTTNAGSRAIIKRKSNSAENKESTIQVDLTSLIEEGETSQNIEIKDGDSIYISKVDVIFVTGEVKKPDSYEYEEGITLIKVVTRAGGFTAKASRTRVKIIRKINGNEAVLTKVKMDEPVLPDDVIVVPESFF
ncbi:MAG: SLBB domain-containing protein [Deltaproteobacteria bacterium]|nr:SLBB domain-containing protein [Deltaproteobacteria bacterium]